MKVQLVSDHITKDGVVPKGTIWDNVKPEDFSLDMVPLDGEAKKALDDFWQSARQYNCPYGMPVVEDPFGEHKAQKDNPVDNSPKKPPPAFEPPKK